EWRIIHTNGGFLTDSLVQKPPTEAQGQSASNSTNSNTNNTSTSNPANAANEPTQINAAVLQRPSDRPATPPGFGQTFGVQNPSAPQDQNAPLPSITLQPQSGQGALPPITLQPGAVAQPGGLPPITLAPTAIAGGQNPGQIAPQNAGQLPGQARPPQNPIVPFPGQAPGGLPGGIPGVPAGFQIDPNGQLVPTAPVPGQGIQGQPQNLPGQAQGIPGQPFTPQPPTSGPVQGSPSSALTAINQLLTGQRQTAPASPTFGANQIGAIAGIASTYKGPSIKIYKDQQKYELWEFVFSPTATTGPGGGTPAAGLPQNGPGPGGTGQPAGPGTPPSTFAPSGTFGPGGGQQPTFGAVPGR
ncbi:MAG TPA: hypothetical protein VFD73_11510, partial [Gemmatimonadales bacterium]|nr:hypothetical protein [Gemmatimonadales bacterium]